MDIEKNRQEELERVQQFANQFSLSRVKTEGLLFDRDYRRSETTGQMELTTEKAVIVTQGKTSKVLFGDTHQYKTYEEAVEGTRLHWASYFKERRERAKQNRSETVKQGERRRSKRYRDKKRDEALEFLRRQ